MSSFFILGFWVGLGILCFTHGKHVMRTVADKMDRIGWRRYYMPYYTYNRKNQRIRSKKIFSSTLSVIAAVLILLGFLAMLGTFN